MNSKIKRNLFILISTAHFMGIFVPTLVLSIIGENLSTIVIVDSAVALSWILFLPLFICKKKKIVVLFLTAVCTIPIFLYITEQCTSPGQWFLNIALPQFLLCITTAGVIMFIWARIKLNTWYGVSATVLVLGVCNYIAHNILPTAAQSYGLEQMDNVISFLIILLALPFLLIGVLKHKQEFRKI